MRKIKYLLTVLLLLVAPRMVSAASNLNISCTPNTVIVGGSVTCNITGNTDLNIQSVTMNLSFGDNVTLGTVTVHDNWQGGLQESGTKLAVYRSTLVTGEFNIATVVVTFGSNHATGPASLVLTGIKFGTDDPILDVNDTSTTVTVNAESTPEAAGLRSLSIINGSLDRQFNTNTSTYGVMLDSASRTTFGVEATAANSSDTVTITNESGNAFSDPSNITFVANDNGTMRVNINVGSASYTLIVSKPTIEASNELASLIIDGVNVDLESGKTEYTVTLNSNKEYSVNAVLKDSEHFKITNLNLPTTMSGSSFAITIEPKDSSAGLSSKTYRITVKTSGSSGGNGGSSGGSSGNNTNPSTNPQTGGIALIMALVLALSFGISMYLYKKNLQNYN